MEEQMQNSVNIVSLGQGERRVRDSKQKPRNAGLFGAGATRYRRWLALGPFGGATPIIETKNEALMPWFPGTFSLLDDVASGLQSPEGFGAIRVSRGGRFDSRG
jgi:hypothetical protein